MEKIIAYSLLDKDNKKRDVVGFQTVPGYFGTITVRTKTGVETIPADSNFSYLSPVPCYHENTNTIQNYVNYQGYWYCAHTLDVAVGNLNPLVGEAKEVLQYNKEYILMSPYKDIVRGVFVGTRDSIHGKLWDFIGTEKTYRMTENDMVRCTCWRVLGTHNKAPIKPGKATVTVSDEDRKKYVADQKHAGTSTAYATSSVLARMAGRFQPFSQQAKHTLYQQIREVQNTVWDGDTCVIEHDRHGKKETRKGKISTQGKWVTINLDTANGLSCIQFESPPPWLISVTVEAKNGGRYVFQRPNKSPMVEIKVSKESVERLEKKTAELKNAMKQLQPRGTTKAEDVLRAHADLQEAIEYRHFSDMVVQQMARSLGIPMGLVTPTVEVRRIDNEKELKKALGTEWVPGGLTTEELVKAGEVLAKETMLGKPVSEEYAGNADKGVWCKLGDLRKSVTVKQLYVLVDKPGQVFQWVKCDKPNHHLNKVGKKSHSGRYLETWVGDNQIAARVTLIPCPSPQHLGRLISRETPIYVVKGRGLVKVSINRLHFENSERHAEFFVHGKNYLETLDSLYARIYYPIVVKDANG